MHVKGYSAPEPKGAVERARLLIEEAEALGQPPGDPLLLFSVLHGFWAVNVAGKNGFLRSPRDQIRKTGAKVTDFSHGPALKYLKNFMAERPFCA